MHKSGAGKDGAMPTRERVKAMTEAGLSPRQIAYGLGISTQRVYQHLKKLKGEGGTS